MIFLLLRQVLVKECHRYVKYVAFIGTFYGSDRGGGDYHATMRREKSINLVNNVPNVVGLLIMEIIVITEGLIW